jgi:hypothetical protein
MRWITKESTLVISRYQIPTMINISMYINVDDPICLPLSMSSGTAMVEARELSFSAMIN